MLTSPKTSYAVKAGTLCFCLAAISAGLGGCDNASESGSAPAESALQGGYTVSDDRILLHSPGKDYSYCINDSLLEEIGRPHVDTLRFRIDRNRLWFINEYTNPQGSLDGGGLTIRNFSGLSRVSGQSGPEGWWRQDTSYYEVAGGIINPVEKAGRDHRLARSMLYYKYAEVLFGFTAGEFRSRIDGRLAEWFIYDWNWDSGVDSIVEADSARNAVDLEALDKYTVRLIGRKTGETVTVTLEPPKGTKKYASDRAGRLPYRSDDPVTTCPDDHEWFERFLSENRKEMVPFKLGSLQTRPKLPKFQGIPWFHSPFDNPPLKPAQSLLN